MQSYELLFELHDPVIQPWYHEHKFKINDFLRHRNESLFAHGLKPVNQNTYETIVPSIMELIRHLIDSLYKTDKEKRSELLPFPNNLGDIGNLISQDKQEAK